MIQIKKGAYTISTTIGKDQYVINMIRIDNIKQFDYNGTITMLFPFDDVTHITVNGKVYDIIQAVAICLGVYYSKKKEKAKGFAIQTKNKIIVSKTIQSKTK